MIDFFPLQLLLTTFGGWVNRRQADVVAYLLEENRVPWRSSSAARDSAWQMTSDCGSPRRASCSAGVFSPRCGGRLFGQHAPRPPV